MTAAPRRGPTLQLVAASAAMCLCFALVEAAQLALGADPAPVAFGDALFRVLPSWILLGLLSPVAWAAAARWPVRREDWPLRAAQHLLLAVPFVVLHLLLSAVWGSFRPGAVLGFAEGVRLLIARYFVYDMICYGAFVGAAHAVRATAAWRASEAHAAVLVAQVKEARRAAAEGRLHPHFALNTLNAIAGLAARGDSRAVVETLTAFGDLLRVVLEANLTTEVPLARELELLEHYLEIQRVRFGTRLAVTWEVDPAAREAAVPPLLLQPLVENSLQHALGRSRRGGAIAIGAGIEDADLVLTVSDTGPDDGAGSGAGEGHGIGLAATRERLQERYGARASVEMEPSWPRGLTVRVRLPLTPATAVAPPPGA